MAKSKRRPVALLNLRSLQRLGSFLEKMRFIALQMTENASFFSSPIPALATFSAHIADLEAAEDKAMTHEPGRVAERNQKYTVVLDDAYSLLSYVQSLADSASDEDEAIAIIAASGFNMKHHGVKIKPDISVKNTKVSGTVQLIAKSPGKYSANEWQMSDDMINWINLPVTLTAKLSVNGLTPGTTKHFRHRSVTKEGESSWSQIVTLVIT
jgi:hypothetical protein